MLYGPVETAHGRAGFGGFLLRGSKARGGLQQRFYIYNNSLTGNQVTRLTLGEADQDPGIARAPDAQGGEEAGGISIVTGGDEGFDRGRVMRRFLAMACRRADSGKGQDGAGNG
ncbi:MAG: hypothetical protein NTX73_00480 [Rhodobacterales bacterium]|nr:hypothetical protein [Rhodobacterales bacterium]